MATNFKQELVGVFGQPVAENPTQAMVEAAFRHHRLPWRYLTIEVAPKELAAAVNGARAMGFRGFNCTIPHKVAVIPFLDALGDSASLMGAVNCVVRREDRLWGENTDGKGFLESLRRLRDPRGARVLLLGAGGAARAIAVELALAGAASITVLNRSAGRGRELYDLLRGAVRERTGGKLEVALLPWEGEARSPDGTDVLVNSTSIGLYPDVDARVPFDLSTLPAGAVVADVIPNPPRTRLVREAQALGHTVIDGLGMLVGQGRLGIEFWTGLMPDEAPMRQALEEVFGGAGAGPA